ncbi:MAG: hypothetical protein KC592_03160 [Nitrospira sp.]|nr:hypothetical protein [Nitrospira sp.]
MVTSHQEWNDQILVEKEDREAVLAVISSRPSVSIEELLHSLPWMRWGYLFSILVECLQEGAVILCQREFQFEVLVSHTLQKDAREMVQARQLPASSENRWATC